MVVSENQESLCAGVPIRGIITSGGENNGASICGKPSADTLPSFSGLGFRVRVYPDPPM